MTAGVPVPVSMRWQSRVWRGGALGFGLGMGLVGLVNATLAGSPSDFDTYVEIITVLYVVTGAIGGLLIGAADKERSQGLRLALGGAIGCGLGYYATERILVTLGWHLLTSYLSGEILYLAAVAVQFGLIGLCAGFFMGASERIWQQAGRAALAGALGFAIGALLQYVVYGPLVTGMLTPTLNFFTGGGMDTVAVVIGWTLASVLYGVVGGAVLGEALA